MKTSSRILALFTGLMTALFVSGAIAIGLDCSILYPFAIIVGLHLVFGKKSEAGHAYELIISDTTYAGTFAAYFWLPATFTMDTLRKGAVYVQDGIKKQHTIGRVDFSKPFQPRAATPVSKGSFTVDGRVLVPKDIMLYTEFNPRDYEQHWLAEQLSPTLLARELPVTAENYMLQIALNRAFEQLELGIWQGSTSFSSRDESDPLYQIQFFDGFIKKMLADSDVYQTPTPVAITTSNINTIFDGLLTHTLKALLANPNRYLRLKFMVSIATEQIYQTFLTTQTFKNNDTTERGINRYKGYDVVPLAGMPDNTVVFAEGLMDTSSNLYLGLNSTEDNALQLMKLQNNSELFFLKGLMKYDTQYGFSNQIALYTTLTSADFV